MTFASTHLLWFRGRLVRDRLQHGLGGERQFLRYEVGDHVGPFPHVLPSLVVVVRAVDLQLKPLSINVRQKRLVRVPSRCSSMYKARDPRPRPHAERVAHTSWFRDYGVLLLMIAVIILLLLLSFITLLIYRVYTYIIVATKNDKRKNIFGIRFLMY